MLGKIILVEAPAPLVRGWTGRLIFRKIGFLVRMYEVKKVVDNIVYLRTPKSNTADDDCFKANLYDRSFFQPVVFLPQAEAEEDRFVELHYSCWARSKYHAAGTKLNLKINSYATHYVNVKHVRQDGARISTRAAVQRLSRSWPKVSVAVGW